MMQYFSASDGIRLAYRVDDFTDPWREPEWLLLLHSAMGSARRFYSWIPGLARRYRVVTPDLRGHGHSQIPPADLPFSLDRLTRDAIELMDHLDIRQAHVVGNSAGGYVAQRLALGQKSRVRTLSLFGALAGLKHSHALTWIPQIQQKGLRPFLAETIHERMPKGVDPALQEWFLAQPGSNDRAFVGRFVTEMCPHDWRPERPGISCPTMIVAPGAEPIGSHDAYVKMAEAIPDAVVVTYEGMPHNICDTLPERCVGDVLDFLARRGGG